jgi:hypothetical protein
MVNAQFITKMEVYLLVSYIREFQKVKVTLLKIVLYTLEISHKVKEKVLVLLKLKTVHIN